MAPDIRSTWSRGLWFRLVGSVLLSVGLGLLFRPYYGPYWTYVAACGSVGVGGFLLAEGTGFWKKKERSAKKRALPSDAVSANVEDKGKVEAELVDKVDKEMMRGWIAAALVIFVALCLWFGSLWKGSYQAQNQIERDLIALLGKPVPGPGPGNTGLQLNPELEKALIDYFRNPAKPTEGLPWFLVAIGAVAAVLLLATKENKEAAPVIAVIPLAGAALKYSESLSKFSGWPFLGIVAVSFLVAAGLIGLACCYREQKEPPEDRKLVSLIFTMGFSVLILLWTFFLVAWCTDCPGGTKTGGGSSQPKPGQPADSPVIQLDVKSLQPVPQFNPGKPSSFSELKGLESDLKGRFKRGDLLLLFGSTDCTRFSQGNDMLASLRASNLRSQLMDNLPNLGVGDIQMESIPQHDQCKEKPDVRAVFPFLVHAEIKKP
jgi:hypothetical protein